ncbi:MAG: peptide ABC transporter substrate-binding protein [Ardenticatenaceae bacterium]
MINKKWLLLVVGALTLVTMALVACGQPAEPVVEIVKETVVVEKEVEVEVEKEVEVVVTEIVEKEVEVEVEKEVEVVVTEIVKEEVQVEATVEVVVTATAEPEVTGPKSIVICQAQEPDTLYIYGGSMLAASHVQAALGYQYNFIVGADYAYQAVGLEELPTLDNGGATMETVTINPGDEVSFVDPESGEIITDTTTLEEALELDQIIAEFKIREGMLWEDGTPITAADYELSWELYFDPDTPNPSRFAGEHVASFEMVDDTTQKVTLLPGWTPADYYATYFFTPLPAHVLGEMAPAEIVESEFARAPLSLGGFKVEEWVEGQYIRVTKNENYWNEGYPKLDEITFKFIPDTNQLLAQLLSGECDVGTEDGMDLDQSPFLEQAEVEGIIIPNYKRGTVWEHIDFGMTSVDGRYQHFGPLGYTDLSELDESDPASWVGTEAWEAAKKVRKAFAHCIDRQRMVDEALYGKSSVISTFIPAEHPMHPGDENLSTYEYDPDAGIALLEEVGWTDSDGDEIVDRNGIKFEVTINTTTGNKMREIITQITQENMRECGVDVIIELMPAREYFGDGPDGPLFGRHFDLGEFAWLTGVEPPTDLYYCDQWPTEEKGWSGQNDPGYCNPDYDAVGKNADGTLARDDQKPLFAEAQAIFSDDLPVLPLFQRISVSATRPGITNYSPNPTINSAMWNIHEWDLE